MGKGIYIKDFSNFPTCCHSSEGVCFAYDEVEYGCLLRKDKRVYFSQRVVGVKPDWCPLLEVEDHGDLIDVTAFLKTIRPIQERDYRNATLMADVKLILTEQLTKAPVIIPKENTEK